MYFPFSELRKRSKKTAETRRRNCAVLPKIFLKILIGVQYDTQKGRIAALQHVLF